MRTLLVCALLTLCACASSLPTSEKHFAPAPAAPPGYATLYIYRGYMDWGALAWPIVFLNDVKVVDLKTDTYSYVYVWPGEYHLRIGKSYVLAQFNDEQSKFDFLVPKEGTYYLSFGNGGSTLTLPAGGSFVSMPMGEFGWFLIPESPALRAMSKTLYQPAYVETVGHQ